MTTPLPTWKAARLCDDVAAQGLLGTDLARKARVSDETVYRAMRGTRMTARTMHRLAKALGQPLTRYLVRRAR